MLSVRPDTRRILTFTLTYLNPTQLPPNPRYKKHSAAKDLSTKSAADMRSAVLS